MDVLPIARTLRGASSAVTGKTAATEPLLAAFVTVAPATVKLFCATPAKVQPSLAVSTIVAVYTVVAANGLLTGAHVIVPVYCVVSIPVVTGVAPVAGATTPVMAKVVIDDGALYTTAVRGEPVIAKPVGLVIVTETVSPLATDIADIARLLVVPVPLNVPLVAPVTVMSLAAKVVGATLKDNVKEVVLAVFDVPPSCSALVKVTSISAATPVAGNTAVTLPEFTAFVAVAPATVKPLAVTPLSVQPAFAVSTMVAVYRVVTANGLSAGDHVIVPVYCAVSIAVVTGMAPRTGATTPGIASKVIVLSDVVAGVAITGVSVAEVSATGFLQPIHTRAVNMMKSPRNFRCIFVLLRKFLFLKSRYAERIPQYCGKGQILFSVNYFGDTCKLIAPRLFVK